MNNSQTITSTITPVTLSEEEKTILLSEDSTKKTNHQLLLELIGNKDSSLMQIYSLIREVYKNDELGKINDAGKSLIHIAVEAGNYNVIPAISAMGSKYLNQRIGEVLSDKNEDQIDDKTETKIGDGEKINYQKSIDYGMAPLHLAIKKDHKSEDLKSIKLLLMGKADVNVKKLETQTTPLHYAVCYDKIKLAEILLNNGADILIKNKKGKDVKDFIYSENHDMKELLEKNLEKSKPSTPSTSPESSSTDSNRCKQNQERKPT